ncbi:MAG TPA: hypothetical protein VFD58_37305 [Blastocatellia bacterium]|nr:hypothetical protein [Blastocatellia bacterium]
MKIPAQLLINAAVVMATAALASAITRLLKGDRSWAGFIGWLIFFAAIQSPFLSADESARGNCAAWLARSRRRGTHR